MMTWILTNSLWLVGLGLMLASSGIDGAYMARWMPIGFGWLGYVLNTTADVSGMVLTYFFGRLQQDKAKAKRKLALFLLPADLVAAAFSWFFSWRQLLIVLPAVEPLAFHWVAPIAAAFIPALLIFIGYAESLLAGRFETAMVSTIAPVVQNAPKDIPVVAPVVAPKSIPSPMDKPQAKPKPITLPEWRALAQRMNGDKPADADGVNEWLQRHGYETKPTTTARRWLEIAQSF